MKNFFANSIIFEPLIILKGALIFLVGPLNLQLAYLFLAVGIDLVFGIQVAKKEKTFEWKLLILKVRKKVLVYVLWISMFHAFDMVAGLPNTARWAVIVMLAGMEIVSAIKNTARLGHGTLADALESLYFSLTKNSPTSKDKDETDNNATEGGESDDKREDKTN